MTPSSKNRKVYKDNLLTYFMKTINETFTDEEHKAMVKLKNGLSWHDFILSMFTQCKTQSIKEKLSAKCL